MSLGLNKIKKSSDNKKNTQKKSTLKPNDDQFSKLDAKKILEKEVIEGDELIEMLSSSVMPEKVLN